MHLFISKFRSHAFLILSKHSHWNQRHPIILSNHFDSAQCPLIILNKHPHSAKGSLITLFISFIFLLSPISPISPISSIPPTAICLRCLCLIDFPGKPEKTSCGIEYWSTTRFSQMYCIFEYSHEPRRWWYKRNERVSIYFRSNYTFRSNSNTNGIFPCSIHGYEVNLRGSLRTIKPDHVNRILREINYNFLSGDGKQKTRDWLMY
jgi:hypothetical protein